MTEPLFTVHDHPGDTGAPTVVAVHDLTGNGRWFTPLAETCEGRVHLIAPDLPGRGDAHAHPGTTTLTAQVQGIVELVAGTGRRCILVGHGTGAALTWMAAQARPGIVEAVVLLDGPAAPRPSGDADWIDQAATVDPGVARLRGSYAHRDQLLAEGIASGRLPDSGLPRALRGAVDAEVAGTGFAWRPRLGAEALRRDWLQLAGWEPTGMPDVPVTALAARHGHRHDDPPLELAAPDGLEWEVVDTTHTGLLWDPPALRIVAGHLWDHGNR